MSSSSHKTKQTPFAGLCGTTAKSVACGIFCLLLFSLSARAERKQYYDFSIDFLGGGSNQAGQTNLRGKTLEAFYSVYPSVGMLSKGERSTISLEYNFVGERFEMDPAITVTSHTFGGTVDAQTSKRTRLRLSNYLNSSPDYSTVYVLKGVSPISDSEFQYVFEPEFYKRTHISNTTTLGMDIQTGARTYLTFSGSGSFRLYEDTAAFRRYLSDQTRIEGNMAFSWKQTNRFTWSLGYRVWQNDYEDFYLIRSHAALLGISYTISPRANLSIQAGPSYREKSEVHDSDVDYLITARISRQFRTNRLSLGYSHYTNDSTGLGGASESHQVLLSFAQALGQRAAINFYGYAYRQQGAYDYDGVYGSVLIFRQLGKYFTAGAGASYRSYTGYYTTKRFYGFVGYRFSTMPMGQ